MKRYLVIYLIDGDFSHLLVMADSLEQALEGFKKHYEGHPQHIDEIYSITLAR